MFEGPLLERPVVDFREAEKVVSVLTVEIKQCIVKKANKATPIEDLVDANILREQTDQATERRGTAWFDQKTQFAQRLLGTLCHVAKFSLFHATPLKSIENHSIDAVKLTDGLLWLRWRYDDLRIDLENVTCPDSHITQKSLSKKISRQHSYDSTSKSSHQVMPAHVSFRRKLNRLERQLLQVAGEIRIRFKSVLATQGWGIPGAYLRVRYHIDLPEEVINLQRDASGDYAVWSLRLNNSNFHGMLPTARLTLMRRHMRETTMVGICETFLFAVENLDGHNSLRGNRDGLLLFRPLIHEPLEGKSGEGDENKLRESTEHQTQPKQWPLNNENLIGGNADGDRAFVQPPDKMATNTTLGPVTAIIVTQIEWRPKNGEVKNVAWPWDSELRHKSADSRQAICI